MKTLWSWSPELEANRLLQTLHNVGNGFYTQNHYLILPDTAPYLDNTVNLPQLPPFSNPSFWLSLRDLNLNELPVDAPPHLLSLLSPSLHDLTPPDLDSLRQSWATHQDTLISCIRHELPSLIWPQQLHIHPTHFGTIGSFSDFDPNHTVSSTLFLRRDANLHTLVECLVSSMLRHFHDSQNLSWRESEAIIDHILLYSPLSLVLQQLDPTPYSGTLSPLQKPSNSLLMLSQEFLVTIAAPPQSHVFTLRGVTPLHNGLPLHHLTSRESHIFSALCSHPGQTLSYDDLGNLIFADDEDYSLTLIAKTIERLRHKLEKNGISGTLIQTDRGRGYYLLSQ